MSEEAFALSPISARAALPSEADYDAIREAFLETSRGRWFLSEYAKRNRNADTNMVLEAVTRMEVNLAAQKKASASVGLLASLGAIRLAIRDAKVVAAEAMPRADDDETMAAARNSARIIREIAWTLRECGADTRICDLLDTHVKAIEADQSRGDISDARAAVLASFDVLVQRIEQLASGESKPSAAAPAATTEAPTAPSSTVDNEPTASVTPLFRAPAPATADIATAPDLARQPAPAEPAPHVAAAAPAQAAPAAGRTAPPVVAVEPEAMTPASMASAVDDFGALDDAAFADDVAAMEADALAEDRAVLDIVAMEMAAPDLSQPEMTFPDMTVPEMAVPEIAVPEMAAPRFVEPQVTAPLAPAVQAIAEPAREAPYELPQASYHPSLGAALIAGGVIPNPNAPASDPLTPIRRMSQAEKIAFFS